MYRPKFKNYILGTQSKKKGLNYLAPRKVELWIHPGVRWTCDGRPLCTNRQYEPPSGQPQRLEDFPTSSSRHWDLYKIRLSFPGLLNIERQVRSPQEGLFIFGHASKATLNIGSLVWRTKFQDRPLRTVLPLKHRGDSV